MVSRYPLSILEFQQQFPDDDSCRRYLVAVRWPQGFVCERCGGMAGSELVERRLWQCRYCGYQASLTSGTVLHGTRLPLTLWFWAAYLVSTLGPGVSAVQLQRQLGIRRYETAWLILHKLRRAMVDPDRTLLTDEIEVDETMIGGHEPDRRGGRQRDSKKTLVAVAIEVRGEGSGRLRLQVIPDASAQSLGEFIHTNVTVRSIVHTDGWVGYSKKAMLGYDHRPLAQAQQDEFLLPRAHRAIGNLKTWLQGTHHGVSPQHLPVYLNEFVFRHNRRGKPMAGFRTLLGLATQHEPTTFAQITTPLQVVPQ